jgi:hypothetical protein
MKHLGFACTLLVTGWAGIANAVVVTEGGISNVWSNGIEVTQTLDTFVSSSGSFGTSIVGSTITNGASTFVASGLNTSHALGYLMNPGYYGQNSGPALGSDSDSSAIRGTIGYTLANGVLNNVTGDDIIVAESGSVGAPEGYMVRVSTNGGSTYSSWVYHHAKVAYNMSGTAAEFLTGFDFVGDFGLGATDKVNLVQIQNANASDKVTGSDGQGTVVFSGDANYSSAYTLTAGTLNTITTDGVTTVSNIAYATGRFDADPTYIFYQSGTVTTTPEPSSIVLLVIGGISALAWTIRRRRATA